MNYSDEIHHRMSVECLNSDAKLLLLCIQTELSQNAEEWGTELERRIKDSSENDPQQQISSFDLCVCVWICECVCASVKFKWRSCFISKYRCSKVTLSLRRMNQCSKHKNRICFQQTHNLFEILSFFTLWLFFTFSIFSLSPCVTRNWLFRKNVKIKRKRRKKKWSDSFEYAKVHTHTRRGDEFRIGTNSDSDNDFSRTRAALWRHAEANRCLLAGRNREKQLNSSSEADIIVRFRWEMTSDAIRKWAFNLIRICYN